MTVRAAAIDFETGDIIGKVGAIEVSIAQAQVEIGADGLAHFGKKLPRKTAVAVVDAKVLGEVEIMINRHEADTTTSTELEAVIFAKIDQRYHAQHAKILEGTDVEPKMTLAAFKRTLKVGDTIVLESTNNPYSQKMVGIERKVVQVRSGDFITEGADGRKIYFDFPKAAAFACDGERFRLADATEQNPDGYRLYRWARS